MNPTISFRLSSVFSILKLVLGFRPNFLRQFLISVFLILLPPTLDRALPRRREKSEPQVLYLNPVGKIGR